MPLLTAWEDPGCPILVSYSREAMEQIRRLAVDGLLELPRIGVGVGGLLLGTRKNGRTTILDSMTIPCSHAEGPPFRLTPEETRQAVEMARSTGPFTLVGWYCSKTRGIAALTEVDLTLFGDLCPEVWQMALLIRPSTVEASHVTLWFRDAAGLVVRGPERPLEPFDQVQVQAEPAATAKLPVAKPPAAKPPAANLPVAKPAVAQPPVVNPTVVDPTAVNPPVRKPAAAWPSAAHHDTKTSVSRRPAEIPTAAEAPPPVTQSAPLFQFAMPSPKAPRSRMSLVGWALVASAIVAGTGTAVYMHHGGWKAAPPLQLSASDANGHLTIRWNPEAVSGIDHASLTLNDGGEPNTIMLDGEQLDAGRVQYDRKSAHVDALMQAGDLRAQVSFPQ